MDGPMAAESLISRLPPETLAEILSFFSNDQQALLNCSLVSQEWLSASRPFLFRSIDLSQVPLRLFVSRVLHSERLQPWLSSIRYLAFTGKEDFIIDISERLSNLRTMEWRYIGRHDALRPEVFPAFAKFTNLYHLEIIGCDFPSFGHLKKIITSFPALSSLTLSAVGWGKSAGPAEPTYAMTPAHTRPALSNLAITLSVQDAEDVTLWLCTTSTPYLLKELSFNLFHIRAALRLMANTALTTLRVRVDKYFDQLLRDDAQAAQLRPFFSQAGHIELLCLRFSESWDINGAVPTLRLFTPVPSIHRLRLCFFWGNHVPRDVVPNMLDAALAPSEGSAFRTLRVVEVAWYVIEPDKTLRKHHTASSAWVRRMLPRLHERCVVDVYIYNDERAFGPTGLHGYTAGDPDFPHALP